MNLILPKERNLFLSKQVDQDSMVNLSKDIIAINENDVVVRDVYAAYGISYNPKPIKIFIDSYGGYVYQCFGLLGIMGNSKTPLHTIVTGCAMSCGFIISIAGHERFAYKSSTFLHHNSNTKVEGSANEIENWLMENKRIDSFVDNHVRQKTSITKQQLAKIKKEKIDWYFDAQQAYSLNVIDQIL